MADKSLKSNFQPPTTKSLKPHGPSASDGCFPRCIVILDFILNDLFCNAYVIPHTDKLPHPNDCLEPTTLDEAVMTHAQTGHIIDRAYILPPTENMFNFSFIGVEDWSPFEAKVNLKNEKNRNIAYRNALPALQDALTEFMEDLALATTNLDGVHVDGPKGTIRAYDPVTLFKVIRALILWRQQQHDVPEGYMNAPVEFRSINLPQLGFEDAGNNNDIDAKPERRDKCIEGLKFLCDNNSCKIALSTLPPRAYNNTEDLFMAAYNTKERLAGYQPMTRLDELEAIVLAEVRKQRSYKANPLLNLH